MKELDDFLDYQSEAVNIEELNTLIRRFMLRVPFENIDVQNKKAISVQPDDLLKKVVEDRRGGYCYELNGLFHAYLKEKGYDVSYAAATVKAPKGWSPSGSHMLNLVQLEDVTYIADVGFGDLPMQAIALDGPSVNDVNGVYRAITISDEEFELQKEDGADYRTLYKARFKALEVKDFAEVLDFNQHHPDSMFVRQLLITQAKENGRVTMSQDFLTITTPAGKTKIAVTADNYRELSHKYFNLKVPIKRLDERHSLEQ